MPFSDADFIQEAAGHLTGTSIVVTLPSGTAAGTTVAVLFNHTTVAVTGVPADWVADQTSTVVNVYHKVVGAGETTWTWTLGSSVNVAWYAVEVENMSIDPYDGFISNATGTTANGATRSTNTSAVTAGSSVVCFAIYTANKAAGGDVQSWSGFTNGFVETIDSAPAGTGLQIAVARKAHDGFATHETTATFATTAAAPACTARIFIFRHRDASLSAPLVYLTGFEFGTHGGMGNGTTPSTNPQGNNTGAVGTFSTNYLVQAGSARSGGYGLRLVASASVVNVKWETYSALTRQLAVGFNIRVVSATGVATVATLVCSGTDVELVYDSSTNKFGVLWTGGTTEWQSGTTALNTWVWVDIRAKNNSSVHHVDWRIETAADTYTDQISPADLTGQAIGSSTQIYLQLGTAPAVAETFTADYDDVVVSRYYAAYPLGPHVVRLLVPETTGATVSGTAANFSQFTANGTLAAFASTNGALLDEVPPTVSASADGVVQDTLAASDYMQFPMTTYTCTPSEIIAGVRMVAPLWGGVGTGTGTLGIRGHDGTTQSTLIAASASYDAASPTAVSDLAPLWNSAIWPNAWTQAKLDAAALRVGFSTDATPTMGVSALYLEVATRPTPVYRQITAGEADEFTVDIRVDPYNSASVSYLIESTHATLGATFNYSISGTPQTPVVVAPSATEEVVVNAATFGEISDVSLEPDAV